MSLTAAEIVDVRRFTGYGVLGIATADVVSIAVAALTTEEEGVIRATFLPALRILETALTGSSSSLDTASAAIWTRNAAELAERSMLYRNERLMLCRFLNIPPGIGIYDPLLIIPDPTSVGDGGGSVGGLSIAPAVFVV